MNKLLSIYLLLFICSGCFYKKNDKIIKNKKSDSLNTLTEYYFNKNQFDSARYFSELAILSDSTNCRSYNNRAVCKFRQNRFAIDVIQDFKTSLKLNPSYNVALFSLANYYDEVNDYKNAIDACDHYIFQNSIYNFSDSSHLGRIKRIILKIKKYQKFKVNISYKRAMVFYDSVNVIFNNLGKVQQQRFVNKISSVLMDMIINKKSITGVDDLDKLSKIATLANTNDIAYIKSILEIDSTLNYKNTVLNFCFLYKNFYNHKIPGFIYCLKSKDVVLIKNSIASITPVLLQIKTGELVLKEAKLHFKEKYRY